MKMKADSLKGVGRDNGWDSRPVPSKSEYIKDLYIGQSQSLAIPAELNMIDIRCPAHRL